MDDAELNKAVAAARGWTPNTKVVRTAIAHALVNEFEPPDVCTDPGSWGGLMEEIAASDCDVALESDYHPDKKWTEWIAVVWRDKVKYVESDLRPGRALALAFLASKGVSTD